MRLVILLTTLLFYFATFANPISSFFSEEIREADAFIENYGGLIKKECRAKQIDYPLAIAIIYPELLRYSYLQNFLETKALEILYINGGKEAADFSIGHFQMKPSFIEDLEKLLKLHSFKVKYPEISEGINSRTQRIQNLKSMEWQIKYLIAFIDLSFDIDSNIPKNYVKYWAAKYNCGLNSPQKLVKTWTSKCSFPYGIKQDNNPFSYAEISYWYYSLKN